MEGIALAKTREPACQLHGHRSKMPWHSGGLVAYPNKGANFGGVHWWGSEVPEVCRPSDSTVGAHYPMDWNSGEFPSAWFISWCSRLGMSMPVTLSCTRAWCHARLVSCAASMNWFGHFSAALVLACLSSERVVESCRTIGVGTQESSRARPPSLSNRFNMTILVILSCNAMQS